MIELGKTYRDKKGGELECTFIHDGVVIMQSPTSSYPYKYDMQGRSALGPDWDIVL